MTTALRVAPSVKHTVREAIVAIAPHRLLEIGPGDAPLCAGMSGVVFLDIAPVFLRPLAGDRVMADLFAAPFADKVFDLVVVADVFTHIRPARRYQALESFLRIGREFIIFNPEPGTEGVADSPSPSRPILDFFETRGFKLSERKFVMPSVSVAFTMRMIIARR